VNFIIELSQAELGIAWIALREFQRTAEDGCNHKDAQIRAFARKELEAAKSAMRKLIEAQQ